MYEIVLIRVYCGMVSGKYNKLCKCDEKMVGILIGMYG